jgi:glucarate dehydratase
MVCDVFNLGVSMHSGGELGISLAAMPHVAASLSNLGFAAGAHYHHVRDSVIKGGKLKYVDDAIAVPTGPGPGVELGLYTMAKYEDEFQRQG